MSKLVVDIEVVEPLTVKLPVMVAFLLTVRSCPIVTSSGRPTTAGLPSVPEPVTSTSFAVPAIVAT